APCPPAPRRLLRPGMYGITVRRRCIQICTATHPLSPPRRPPSAFGVNQVKADSDAPFKHEIKTGLHPPRFIKQYEVNRTPQHTPSSVSPCCRAKGKQGIHPDPGHQPELQQSMEGTHPEVAFRIGKQATH